MDRCGSPPFGCATRLGQLVLGKYGPELTNPGQCYEQDEGALRHGSLSPGFEIRVICRGVFGQRLRCGNLKSGLSVLQVNIHPACLVSCKGLGAKSWHPVLETVHTVDGCEIHLAPPEIHWNGSILLQVSTNHGFNHVFLGAKGVRNHTESGKMS